MSAPLPYLNGYGTLKKILEKIRVAAVPPRFTQDFLSTKLGFKGGTPRPAIPFLKRTGFLGSDGVPTELYSRYRNSSRVVSGQAAAEALRTGFAPLYEINEYVHEASDEDLKGLVVQITGSEEESSQVKGIVGSFKTLKEFADFSEGEQEHDDEPQPAPPAAVPNSEASPAQARPMRGLNLSYTITLNLPATPDIKVFDAIFKSLKENLLKP